MKKANNMTKLKLLKLVRQANSKLMESLTSEGIPWTWIDTYVNIIARDFYNNQPHWHSVSGKCIKDIPFEIYMESLTIFSTAWTTDIFLRKARDRHSQGMKERWIDFNRLLNSLMDYFQEEIGTNRDLDAEAAYQKDLEKSFSLRHKKIYRLKHLINKFILGH